MSKRRSKQHRQNISKGMTKGKEETIRKLCEGFAIDLNIVQACHDAGISTFTYYDWLKKDPDLSNKFDAWRNNLAMKAKGNIAFEIHKGPQGDVKLSERYLIRKEPDEYGEKVKIEHSGDIGDGTPEEDKAVIAKYHAELIANRVARSQKRAKEEGEIK